MTDEELFSPGEEPLPAATRAVPRRGYRILYPLLALMVLVALVPLGTLAWKLTEKNRESLEISQQENQHLIASSIKGGVDSRLDGLKGRLAALAGSLGVLVQAQGVGALEGSSASRPMLGRLLDEDLVSLRLVTTTHRTWQ